MSRTPTPDLIALLHKLAADIEAAEPGGGAPIEEAAQRMDEQRSYIDLCHRVIKNAEGLVASLLA